MGRKVMRVPMDFNWPTGKRWKGYVNDQGRPCPAANQSCFDGYTGAARWLDAFVRLILLAATESRGIATVEDFAAKSAAEWRDRRCLYPHPYLKDLPSSPTFRIAERRYGLVPTTQDLTEVAERLVNRERLHGPCGFDSTDVWSARKHLIELLGLPASWGTCPVCEGHALDPATREAYEAWTGTDPPKGDGYQLWETTSEGSPVSPVFSSLDDLATWCETEASPFGNSTATKEEWLRMFNGETLVQTYGETAWRPASEMPDP